MRSGELIRLVRRRLKGKVQRKVVEQVMRHMIKAITESLGDGEPVYLAKCGILDPHVRRIDPRVTHDKKERLCYVVYFRASAQLKARLKQEVHNAEARVRTGSRRSEDEGGVAGRAMSAMRRRAPRIPSDMSTARVRTVREARAQLTTQQQQDAYEFLTRHGPARPMHIARACGVDKAPPGASLAYRIGYTIKKLYDRGIIERLVEEGEVRYGLIPLPPGDGDGEE